MTGSVVTVGGLLNGVSVAASAASAQGSNPSPANSVALSSAVVGVAAAAVSRLPGGFGAVAGVAGGAANGVGLGLSASRYTQLTPSPRFPGHSASLAQIRRYRAYLAKGSWPRALHRFSCPGTPRAGRSGGSRCWPWAPLGAPSSCSARTQLATHRPQTAGPQVGPARCAPSA